MKAYPILRDTIDSKDVAFALPDGKFAPFFGETVQHSGPTVYGQMEDRMVIGLDYPEDKKPAEVVGILTPEGAQMFETTQGLRVYVDADDEEGCLIENPAKEGSWLPLSIQSTSGDWALSHELATRGAFVGGPEYNLGDFMGYLTAEGLQEVYS